MLKTAASTMACPGSAPRVATSVAIAFAASWKPFVSANASAKETANHRATGQSSARGQPGVRALVLSARFPSAVHGEPASGNE